MRVFISHSSKDKGIAILLQKLIEDTCMDAKVFSASDKHAIPQAVNYNDYIFSNLENCTAFIPLLSRNFYESRYCMIELGIATAKLMNDYNNNGKRIVFPFSVYPTKKELALANTPLAFIQVSDLKDIVGVEDFLRDNFTINIHCDFKAKLEQFEYDLTQLTMSEQSIVGNASRVFPCFDESSVEVKDRKDYIQCSVDEDKKITVNYNFNPYEIGCPQKPSFASVVIQYIDGLDLFTYLRNVPKAELCFDFHSFTNSITNLSVEIKYGDNHIVLFHPFRFNVHKGIQECKIPLSELTSEKLKSITEICFVIHGEDVVEDEGSFMIENLIIK